MMKCESCFERDCNTGKTNLSIIGKKDTGILWAPSLETFEGFYT